MTMLSILLVTFFVAYTPTAPFTKAQVVSLLPHQPIRDALYLHNQSISNYTLRDCIFRPSTPARYACPDPALKFILYTSNGTRQLVDLEQGDWLRQSAWDPTKENVLLVHGYSGGDRKLPSLILRDAYLANGSFNVWQLDWGALSFAPCYRAAVNNMRAVARCTGDFLTTQRRMGLPMDRLTCVGHSLGAHLCGLIGQYVQFRIHRIIGLDPARPLIRTSITLGPGAAAAVHVLHTNAGHYGDSGSLGHADFCINGGRVQPFCEKSGLDENLCSHLWSVCYQAESLTPGMERKGEPCGRRCPVGASRPGTRIGIPIVMGQDTPLSAAGTYCVSDRRVPYCPRFVGDVGDVRCCMEPPPFLNETQSEQNTY